MAHNINILLHVPHMHIQQKHIYHNHSVQIIHIDGIHTTYTTISYLHTPHTPHKSQVTQTYMPYSWPTTQTHSKRAHTLHIYYTLNTTPCLPHTCAHTRACMHTYKHMCTHMNAHPYIQTHVHTHTTHSLLCESPDGHTWGRWRHQTWHDTYLSQPIPAGPTHGQSQDSHSVVWGCGPATMKGSYLGGLQSDNFKTICHLLFVAFDHI